MSDAVSETPAAPVSAATVLAPSEQVLVQRDLWKHRRGMAFLALWATIAAIPAMFGLCYAAPDAVVSRVSQLQALLIGLIVPLIGLAGAYMGLATVYGDNSASNLTAPKS